VFYNKWDEIVREIEGILEGASNKLAE